MFPREIQTESGTGGHALTCRGGTSDHYASSGWCRCCSQWASRGCQAGRCYGCYANFLRAMDRLSRWGIVVFLSVFVIAAMMPFGFQLFILAGRTRVTVGKDRIVTTEIAGPVRWSRKFPFNQIDL